jgi:hypothetical protein
VGTCSNNSAQVHTGNNSDSDVDGRHQFDAEMQFAICVQT